MSDEDKVVEPVAAPVVPVVEPPAVEVPTVVVEAPASTETAVVVNQHVEQHVDEVVVVEAPQPEKHAEPAKPPFWRRAVGTCGVFVKNVFTFPLILIRKWKHPVDSLLLFSVHSTFACWLLIVMGFLLAGLVRLDPNLSVAAGWTYAFTTLVFFLGIGYDLNIRKLALIGVVFFAVFIGLKYAEDVKHWIILGAITEHLRSLRPSLDPGYASVISWLLLVPFVYCISETFSYGLKRFTPNEVIEYHIFERGEYLDRVGVKFSIQYRDVIETMLTFGGGDIVILDNHGTEFKRFENILFLYFLWPRLERIIEQRAVVEDPSDGHHLGDGK